MHRSHRFLAQCLSAPWAMTPAAMTAYAALLARGYARREGVASPVASEDWTIGGQVGEPRAAAPDQRFGRTGSGAIAVVRVHGVIMQRASQLGACEEGAGTDQIVSALQAAMNDETVGQVLMDFDTPGGSVFGVQETGDQIREMAKTKPVFGIANSLCASAGYWLMSQCTECYVTPGGQVGSIGVYGAHEDISKAMETAGVSMTFISAGKYKVEGHPFAPLGDEAHAAQQASVDAYYKTFISAVAKGRGVSIDAVRNGMGEGRVLGAQQALAENMVNGVMTFDAVVRKMQAAGGRNAAPPRSRSALASARRQIDMLA